MINLHILTELPKDLAIMANIVTKVQTNLPLIQKNLADLSQAIADKNNPQALMTDTATLLADFNSDLQVLADLLPPSTPTPPSVAPTA